jgi:hypothetical protein
LSGVVNNYSYLNKSLYPGDVPFDATFNEFRIYIGVLLPDEVASHETWGPNQLVSTAVSLGASLSGGNVVLSWPSSETGWTLQTKSSLTPGGAWSPGPAAQVVGNQWQATVTNTGGTQFFRLIK